MMKLNGKSVIIKLSQPAIFIVVGALARLIPHPANFAPIGAMAIFGGVYLNKKQAFALPILAMIVSDLFLGFGSIPVRISVYASFLLAVGVGFWIKKRKNFKNVVFASLFSSLLFFLITNFAVWAFGGMYSRSFQGLAECYFLAIPFFRNTILGDLTYSGVFFGGYELVQNFLRDRNLAFDLKT